MEIVICYTVYPILSITATAWVGSTLFKNGRAFLVDAFHGNSALADSINHLLVVGFYLINIGYVTLALRTSEIVANPRQGMELVSSKFGVVLVVLGAMHFMNLYIFNRLRKSGAERHMPPPLLPNARL
jgi:hypothetical protein